MMPSAIAERQTLLSLTRAIRALLLSVRSFSFSACHGVERNDGFTTAPLTSRLPTTCKLDQVKALQ